MSRDQLEPSSGSSVSTLRRRVGVEAMVVRLRRCGRVEEVAKAAPRCADNGSETVPVRGGDFLNLFARRY